MKRQVNHDFDLTHWFDKFEIVSQIVTGLKI